MIRVDTRGSAPHPAGAAPLRPAKTFLRRANAVAALSLPLVGPEPQHFRSMKSLARTKARGVEQTQILRAVIWPVLK